MKYQELAKKAARAVIIFAMVPAVIAGLASVLVPMIGVEVLEALVYMGFGLVAREAVKVADKWIS
jgi:hypothetical protein